MTCHDIQAKLIQALNRNAYSASYTRRLYRGFQDGKQTSTQRCQVEGSSQTETDESHEDMVSNLLDQRRTSTAEKIAEHMGIVWSPLDRKIK